MELATFRFFSLTQGLTFNLQALEPWLITSSSKMEKHPAQPAVRQMQAYFLVQAEAAVAELQVEAPSF